MRIFWFSLVACLALAGCGGALRPLPLASVSSDGVVMRGTLTPRMDFTGGFALSAEGMALTCMGETAADGRGSMVCSDGTVLPLAIPKPPYGRFSGAVVQSYADRRVAVGWGAEAEPVKLRAMLGQ